MPPRYECTTLCIYAVRYEWDEAKNQRNQRKHDGISFELAALVFEDERCLVYPDRIDDEMSEQRWHAVGMAQIEPQSACRAAGCPRLPGGLSMAKKSSASSRPARLKSMRSEDIRNRRWTEKERQALRGIASRQAVGDDSRINFEDIPRLTESSWRVWCGCAMPGRARWR